MRKLRKIITYTGILLIGTWFAGFVVFNYQINHLEADAKSKTDAIVALTGGRNRISQAVYLFNHGMADKLFISGVSKKTSLQQIENRNDIQVEKKQLVEMGNQAQDTIGNAVEADAWIKENKIGSIRLVTSNYHIPRSMLEFAYQNPEVNIIPYPVYSDKVDKKWWKSWGSFCLIFTEYNKFLYVYITKKIF